MAAPRSIEPLRRRVCSIIDIGTADDFISRGYDILYTLVILINLAVTIAYTFDEVEARFIRIHLTPHDRWVNTAIRDLGLPEGVIVAAIQRGSGIIVPRGDVFLASGDNLVLGAESYEEDARIQLKEVVLQEQHPWNGHAIRDLDISRQTVIVMVRRRGRMLIPRGSLKLLAGDKVILYTQSHLPHAQDIQI